MDYFYDLGHLRFVWDEQKAASNILKHKLRFEDAAEVFLDPLLKYGDASPNEELRIVAIGRTYSRRILFVVHIELDGDMIRLISAWDVSGREKKDYENNSGTT